jgi:hypothetical protein
MADDNINLLLALALGFLIGAFFVFIVRPVQAAPTLPQPYPYRYDIERDEQGRVVGMQYTPLTPTKELSITPVIRGG